MIYNNDIIKRHVDKVNYDQKEIESLSEYFKSLNIIDPESLSTEDISLFLNDLEDYDNLINTSQLTSIDYSDFKNHIFFDSAINKVNYTINKILNFPYDKSKNEFNKYISSVEGFTDYILKNEYPKYKGSINFLGSQKLVTKNKSDDQIGILCPDGRYSFNFWIDFNSESLTDSNNQMIFKFFDVQAISGFMSYISKEDNKYYINYLILNNNIYKKTKSEIFDTGFQNINININDVNGLNQVSFFVNGFKQNTIESATSLPFVGYNESLKTLSNSFIIGNSENLTITIDDENIIFSNLNAKIDDFRFYHNIQTEKQIKNSMADIVFAKPDLKLYYKFNEPPGNYTQSNLCLDSSGNKINGVLKDNDDNEIVNTDSFKSEISALVLEKIENSPVLMPHFSEIENLRQRLMTQARDYDKSNSNCIFNLFPKHYFLEASDQERLPIYSNDDSLIFENNDGSISRQPANTKFVNIVLIWAKFFDQLKLYVDAISSLADVDYDTLNNKKFLGIKIPLLCKLYGLSFTEIFPSITSRKKNKEALVYEDIVLENSIRQIQNQIWHKALINSQSFLKAKGTLESIETIKSIVGVNILNNLEVNEKSSFNDLSNKQNIFEKSRRKIIYNSFVVKEFLNVDSTFNNQSGFSLNKPFLEIQNIKNSSFNVANDFKAQTVKDGLGDNFSIEMYFNLTNFFDKKLTANNITGKNTIIQRLKINQSIFRVDYENSPIISVHAVRKYTDRNIFDIFIEIKTLQNSYAKNASLVLENVNIVENIQYICLTQSLIENNITYSAYLDKLTGKTKVDNLIKATTTLTLSDSQISNLNSNRNNLNLRVGSFYYDNSTTELFSIPNTDFEGSIYNIRTWSKSLSELEVENHVNNIYNVSESNLNTSHLVNNFMLKNDIEDNNIIEEEGKKYFLVENCSNNKKSDNSEVNTCKIGINNLVFDVKRLVKYREEFVKNKNFKVDTSFKENRVNIVSFIDEKLKQKYNNYNIFPSHNMPEDTIYEQSNDFSIDFSVCKMLNDDISQIIADLDKYSKFISGFRMYDYDYYSIKEYRQDYFKRYEDKNYINYSSLGNIFKYLDSIMTNLIKDMIPSKTSFNGFNLVYESHVLERHKYEYKNSDSRIPVNQENIRNAKYNIGRLMHSASMLEI